MGYDVLSYSEVVAMRRAKIAISLDEGTLQRLERLVDEEVVPNREKALADEGLSDDVPAWSQ